MRKAAPKQQAMWQYLDLLEDGRPRGGKPGSDFEDAVPDCLKIAAQIEGERAKNGQRGPGCRHNKTAIPSKDCGVMWTLYDKESANHD